VRDELLPYYERELTFLRHLGAEFAEKYPKIAARLSLEADKCEDPHVERLLESFAFLAARLHLKIDDEFPEITEPLLGTLYPDYIRPIPSMSVAEFQVDPAVKLTTGVSVKKGSNLYSRPVSGVRCKFRTCYEATLWPLTVAAAEWKTPDRLQPAVRTGDAVGAVRLELHCDTDVTLESLKIPSLRFYLQGEGRLVHTLYELLCNNCAQILVRDLTPKSKAKPVVLPRSAVRAVGFSEDEGMSPFTAGPFLGYRLLQEYFNFPQKFLFVEVNQLQAASAAGFREKAEIIFLISPFERNERRQLLEQGVRAKTFRLGCAPIINLFEQAAEPVLLSSASSEYPVIPDSRRRQATEVFSIDEVAGVSAQAQPVRYQPLYSRSGTAVSDRMKVFWTATRRPSGRRDDEGTEMHVSLVDISARPVRAEADSLAIKVTCTNRDLPARLPWSSDALDFELEGSGAVRRAAALTKPTPTVRPPVKNAFWDWISQLSLNYLSEVPEGKPALQQILRMYNSGLSPNLEREITGISNLKSRRHFARIVSADGIAFARGTLVEY
jgi:type VI secretion system protein ImpG